MSGGKQSGLGDPTGSAAAPSQISLLPVAISAEQSCMIKVARVLCIFFMMTTHAWPGSDRILAADVGQGLHLLYVVVIDLLGRAAVPLLSMISGLLFVHTFVRRSPQEIIVSKFKTLVVPMAVWSLPMIAIAFGREMIIDQSMTRMNSPWDWVNSLLAITDSPANGPLHFLREIFIMALYGLLILQAYRISRAAGVLLAIAVLLLEQIPGGFLLFRNQIATMYIFGLLLACLGHARWKPSWALIVVLLAFLLAARAQGWLEPVPGNPFLFRLSQHLPRVAMSFLMWRLAYEIASRPNLVRRLCLHFEPHIFTIFCAHAIVASFVGAAAHYAGLRETSAVYPVILAAQLALFFAIGRGLSELLRPLPWLRGRSG